MDPMYDLISGFPAQLAQAIEIGQAAQLKPANATLNSVAVMGLGGSAFGAEITRNLIEQGGKVPFTLHRGYSIPDFVGPNTLCIASSYSGNTEETLASLELALAKEAQIVCITSGGRMAELAKRNGLPLILIPEGFPPRTAVGFSFVQQLYVLRHFGLIQSFEKQLKDAILMLKRFNDHELAKSLAAELHGKLPILYVSDAIDCIGLRMRQQINENSKQLCWHHVLPEMNHNELVGWELPTWLHDKAVVVMVRSDYDHPRVGYRFEINETMIRKYTQNIVTVHGKGTNKLEQILYLLHLTDWLSYYLAELNGVEPTPVKVIDYLKSELGKR